MRDGSNCLPTAEPTPSELGQLPQDGGIQRDGLVLSRPDAAGVPSGHEGDTEGPMGGRSDAAAAGGPGARFCVGRTDVEGHDSAHDDCHAPRYQVMPY